MLRRATLIAAVIVLLALSAASALAATPAIQSVAITLTQTSGDYYPDPPEERHVLTLYDADGVADITQVTLQPPFGALQTYPTTVYSADSVWTVVDANTMTLDVGASAWSGASGTFTYTVYDTASNTDTITLTGAPAIADTLALTSPTDTSGVITDVLPTFAWTGAQPEAHMVLSLHSLVWDPPVWSYDAGSATSVVYNTDGTAREAQLTPGCSYVIELYSDRQIATSDPRVTVHTVQWYTHWVLVYSADPVIAAVGIIRASDRRGPSWALAQDRVSVDVTDGLGYSDVASISITDPAGVTHDFTPSSPAWHYSDAHTALLIWDADAALGDPTPGAYTITARSTGGYEATLTTPAIPANPPFQMVSPPADGTTADTLPTFSWSAPDGAQVDLTLLEEGSTWFAPVWEKRFVTGGSVVYNADGRATRTELLPGFSYLLQLHYYTAEWLPGTRVIVTPNQYLASRFTVSAAGVTTPTLPGKLAYGICFEGGGNGWDGPNTMLQYESDSSARHWLGPVGGLYPNWAPDGGLLYTTWDPMAINRDPLDGSTPTTLPIATAEEFSPSPDGTRIVYRDSEHGYNGGWLWTANIDGSGAQAIVESLYARWPKWSPDGAWIAYRDGDGTTDSLRLIRPDGTEGHVVTVTGVDGYPGSTVTYSGESSWSPDSSRLVTTFGADDGAGGAIHGLGIVPRDGGLLTPVLLDDADHVCCAASGTPEWSPKGNQIVFASGRHLDPNPEWPYGYFESGVELWVMNADGTGEPQRLTYDQFFPYYITWSIPHTFTDVKADFWAFDSIEACHAAGLVQGYKDGTYQPKWLVNRGQMAIYIARALCDGEAHVPTGPATPSFSDVGPDRNFYDHVEYLTSHGVVTGYSDGTYHPEWFVNRGQMAAFLARAKCGGEDLVPTGPATPSFPDVAQDFKFYDHIEYIYSAGITTGKHDGLYHPEENCLRDQMAVFIGRAFLGMP